MRAELFIARRLKPGGSHRGTLSLNVALVAIVLAIVVMIVSLAVVMGFKKEITTRLNSLDAHIRISEFANSASGEQRTIKSDELISVLKSDEKLGAEISSIALVAEWPVILKTMNDFNGLHLRAVSKGYDWKFIKNSLVAGRVPNAKGENEVIISSATAKLLGLHNGDKVLAYFIKGDKVKVRNCKIVGVFRTDFDTFDTGVMMSDIGLVQEVNEWGSDEGTCVAIELRNTDVLEHAAYRTTDVACQHMGRAMNVTHTKNNNSAYYTWLSMLDMNEVVIVALMFFVAAFTLIAAMLMIVLRRMRTIGLLKSMGATNGMVRRVFVFLTSKLLLKAVVIGNVVGLSLAFAQKHFHFAKLDPQAYYMPYVPVHLDATAIIALNAGFVILAIAALLVPSFIASSISPSKTMHYE